MKHLQLHENFIKRLYHKSVGGQTLPKEIESQISLLIDAFMNFFTKIDGLNRHKITKEVFYNVKFEYPLNYIKMHVTKEKSQYSDFNLLKVMYEVRRIPPEISIAYFGKIVHQTTELDMVRFENDLYDIPDRIYMDADYLAEYVNDIFKKHELRPHTDEISIDKIPDIIKELSVDDFEFFINTKKYNL